jgi:hypothetical protein
MNPTCRRPTNNQIQQEARAMQGPGAAFEPSTLSPKKPALRHLSFSVAVAGVPMNFGIAVEALAACQEDWPSDLRWENRGHP